MTEQLTEHLSDFLEFLRLNRNVRPTPSAPTKAICRILLTPATTSRRREYPAPGPLARPSHFLVPTADAVAGGGGARNLPRSTFSITLRREEIIEVDPWALSRRPKREVRSACPV